MWENKAVAQESRNSGDGLEEYDMKTLFDSSGIRQIWTHLGSYFISVSTFQYVNMS